MSQPQGPNRREQDNRQKTKGLPHDNAKLKLQTPGNGATYVEKKKQRPKDRKLRFNNEGIWLEVSLATELGLTVALDRMSLGCHSGGSWPKEQPHSKAA